ncbi:uncharacterized protein LOC122368340 isoform X1 [Amphibalanus amphitrite]|uniref:uncharacterized protein LOC122368340 isoform X1 n=1 Tax=Amphibalanus amphitrite TaxID=1232801 RepID=UPI001C90ACC1|nr:uncharacterized protein LOC122368340 isoform X1 [Amphibalanus amphitrite]
MIGRPAPSAAAIGPSAVEELVEAALTGAVALLLWTGLRRVVGVAAPVLWSRARRLVSFKPSHQTGDSPLSDEATTSADDTTDRVVGSVQPVMCSVAGSRGSSGSGAAAAVDGGRPPDSDGATQARPVFEAQGVSFGDGVVISDEGRVTSGVLDQNGVTMSEVGVDQSAPTNVQCRTDGVGCDTDVADDAVVPRTEQDCDSDVSDEVNPCNQTFYSEGDGEDADAESDENEYDLGENQPEQDDDYDDWFAVSNDDEIRTIATADLQPFYEEAGSAEPGRRPAAMFHLAGDLGSEPDFIEGYSCLETIVEENSDDMRSDSDSLRSGPASRDWSEDSDGQDGTTSPSALTVGPPGWTWCLEPSDSTGAADDWGSEEECEPKPRVRRASAGDELLEADGLGRGGLMSWDQPLTKSCVGAPLFSELPPARPLAATTSAAWRQSPELLSQMAPLSHSDFRGHHWRVDNEPISAELSCAGPGGRRHSDPGTFGGRIGLPVTLAEPSDGRDDRPVNGGRPVSPQGHRRSPERPAPTPRSGRSGSDAPAIGHDPTTGGLGAARNAQLAASTAERCAVSAECAAVTSTPTGARGGTEAPGATADGRVPTAADPKWDLGSCEDFENLDRRIESLTFDFEEEERTLQTLESLESATDVQRRRYQRLSSSRQASTEEPNQLCEPVRRFHSSGDLTMIGDDARSERPAARRSATKTTQIDGDSNSARQTNISTPETTVPRPHARVELLRHSSENLSEDSGFGEQTVGARSSSEASSPPPSLSLTTPREESSGQPETAPSRLSRRSQSTPDLSPSAQRRRRLLELIGRDERRRARVYLDAAASDARDAAGLDAAAQPTVPRRQLSLETAPVASKERPVPAPRSAPPKPAAVYQNVPPNAWLAALAAGDGKEAARRTTQPPENQLMRGGEAARQLSRHELRFQRSLRNLHTPEWYRRAAVAPTAALRRNLDTASLQGGWSGLSSKSNSKESLPTSSVATPTPVPRRGDWRSFRAARETASVPGTASASPVPLYRRASAGSARRPGPPPTGAPAVTAAQSLRRPYLGWRSQEKLIRQGYQTPVERLASSFRGTPGVRRQVAPPEQSPASADPARPPPPTDDVKTSIREVSDAIVHYFDPDVQGQNGRMGSPATARTAREESPSKHRAMWLETAFVGNRPAEGSGEPTKGGSTIDRLLAPSDARKERFELDGGVVSDIDPDDGADAVTCDGADAVTKRLASVTMDDVLDSLLAMRRPSPPDGPCRRGDPLGEPVLRTRPRRSHPARV